MYEAIEKTLKKFAPDVTDHEIHHQMEYLKVVLQDGTMRLEGPGYREKPKFLGTFYGKDDELIPKTEAALQTYYEEAITDLKKRVMEPIHLLKSLNVEPEILWLQKKKNYPIEGKMFLGLPVRYHDNDEEFIIALGRLRAAPLKAN